MRSIILLLSVQNNQMHGEGMTLRSLAYLLQLNR